MGLTQPRSSPRVAGFLREGTHGSKMIHKDCNAQHIAAPIRGVTEKLLRRFARGGAKHQLLRGAGRPVWRVGWRGPLPSLVATATFTIAVARTTTPPPPHPPPHPPTHPRPTSLPTPIESLRISGRHRTSCTETQLFGGWCDRQVALPVLRRRFRRHVGGR